jgi:hypothetical protein
MGTPSANKLVGKREAVGAKEQDLATNDIFYLHLLSFQFSFNHKSIQYPSNILSLVFSFSSFLFLCGYPGIPVHDPSFHHSIQFFTNSPSTLSSRLETRTNIPYRVPINLSRHVNSDRTTRVSITPCLASPRHSIYDNRRAGSAPRPSRCLLYRSLEFSTTYSNQCPHKHRDKASCPCQIRARTTI